MSKAEYIYMGKLAGLSMEESLYICPGLLYDLYTIYLRVNGLDNQGS